MYYKLHTTTSSLNCLRFFCTRLLADVPPANLSAPPAPPRSPDAAADGGAATAAQTAATLKKEKRKRPKLTLELLQVIMLP